MAVTPNEIATTIVDAALKIHVALGPGLLESAYEPVRRLDMSTNRNANPARRPSAGRVQAGGDP